MIRRDTLRNVRITGRFNMAGIDWDAASRITKPLLDDRANPTCHKDVAQQAIVIA
jgi:hypothetical protein